MALFRGVTIFIILAVLTVLFEALALSPAEYKISGLEAYGSSDDQYSGLMPIKMDDNDRGSIFFYLAKARSSLAPTAPLVVWLNGGPGCSSAVGLINENGPYKLSAGDELKGETKYVLTKNDNSWNNVANILYVEQPILTGFSLATKGSKRVKDEYELSRDMYGFIQNFLSVFVEYQGRDIYITGESYGGRYIPLITQEFVRQSKETLKGKNQHHHLNIKGAMIGNGAIDEDAMGGLYAEYAYSHGMISKSIKDAIVSKYEHCLTTSKKADCGGDHMDDVMTAAGRPNEYNTGTFLEYSNPYSPNYIISDTAIPTVFFNDPEIQRMFHVRGDKSNVPGINYELETVERASNEGVYDKEGEYIPGHWDACSDEVGADMKYDRPRSSVPAIKYLINQPEVRVLLYSGDLDLNCNMLGTLKVLETNSWIHDKYQWSDTSRGLYRPTLGADPAIPITGIDAKGEYSYLPDHKFAFLIIKNSGHLLPMDVPDVALDFFTRFIRKQGYADTDLPSYKDFSVYLKHEKARYIEQGSLDSFGDAFWLLALLSFGATLSIAFYIKLHRKPIYPSESNLVQMVDTCSSSNGSSNGKSSDGYTMVDTSSAHGFTMHGQEA